MLSLEKNTFATLFSVLIFALSAHPVSALEASIVTVTASGGGGDYECDGVKDQIQLNAALDEVAGDPNRTTVYLQGPMTCIIDEPVLLSGNTILKGDATVTVKLQDDIHWNTPNKPLIGHKNTDGTVSWQQGEYGSGSIANVEISGFELEGGHQIEPYGQYFVILINLYNASHVKIHDMNLHDSRGDIIRFFGSGPGQCTDLKVYNNRIAGSGHEGISFIYAEKVEAYNNTIYNTRTNSGIRLSSSSNFSVHDNNIENSLARGPSGYAGILIDTSFTLAVGNANIFNNYIYGKNGGIVLEAREGFDAKNTLKNVHIHHNTLYMINNYADDGYLNGAIRINGFHNTLIEYNTIEASADDGIVYDEYNGTDGRGNGYQTIVRNNIISNCKGYGINNLNPDIHQFVSINNDVYNNHVDADGNSHNYNNVVGADDLHVDPQYVERAWHHVAGTYEHATEMFTIYVDGQERGRKHLPGFGTVGNNNENIYLGAYLGGFYPVNGVLDDVAIWTRVLTAAEIAKLWNNGDGIEPGGAVAAGLISHWQMDNDWRDSLGAADFISSSAVFTTNSKLGEYAGSFHDSYVALSDPSDSFADITIATWIHRDQVAMSDLARREIDTLETLFSKGSQGQNNHIWLSVQGETFSLEFGNGEDNRATVSSFGIKPNLQLSQASSLVDQGATCGLSAHNFSTIFLLLSGQRRLHGAGTSK